MTKSEIAHRVMREPIFYGGEGAFPFQNVDFAADKYAADDDWLIANRGASIGDMVAVTNAVGKLISHQLGVAIHAGALPLVDPSILAAFTFTIGELAVHLDLPLQTIAAVVQAFTLESDRGNESFQGLNDFNAVNALRPRSARSPSFFRSGDAAGRRDLRSNTTLSFELLRLPFELTISQSFGFVERQAALSRMNLALRRMKSAEDEALSLRAELTEAKDDVAAGRASFGEHHMTVALRACAPDELDEALAEVQASLADLGILSVREDIALEPAFWAQFPGNFKYIARRGLVSTSNFAGLASCHNFALGKPSGNHWGDAVTLLETTAAGPYFFNFHQSDLGNFTVIGPSGSGKTVVVNFLLAQARKFLPRIIFFDKDRGAELFIRAIGGRYDVLRPTPRQFLGLVSIKDYPGQTAPGMLDDLSASKPLINHGTYSSLMLYSLTVLSTS